MIFSKKLRRSKAVEAADPRPIETLFEEIEALTEANRAERDPDVTRRILGLRHQAGLKLVERPLLIMEATLLGDIPESRMRLGVNTG